MKKTVYIPEQKTPYFTMRSLNVTVNRDLTHLNETLSKADFVYFLHLHQRMQEQPKQIQKEVEELLVRYPNHPEIMNLLTYLLLARRKLRKAHKLIVQNYDQNPGYLLGKINYADYCIQKGKIDNVPKIFDQKFDLRLIDPIRSVFHLSEYRGFMVVMSFYQLALKNKEAAEAYFYLAYTIDKSHSSVQLLKKKIYKKRF